MIDILLPLGPGSLNGDDRELRYCLRSIEKHAKGLRRVWIVGHRPRWGRESDAVRFVERAEFDAPKESRISLKVLWAFENLDVTETVAFWNDDYVLTKDTDLPLIPNYYSGGLWTKRRSPWGAARRATRAALIAAGLSARNYDIHVPILFEREKYIALGSWWSKGYVGKSVYGNHYCHSNSHATADCKLWRGWRSRVAKKTSRRFVVSYGDVAARRGLLGWLEQALPQPSAPETARNPPAETVKRQSTNERWHFLVNGGEPWTYFHFFYGVYLPLTAALLDAGTPRSLTISAASRDRRHTGFGALGRHILLHPLIANRCDVAIQQSRDEHEMDGCRVIEGADFYQRTKKAGGKLVHFDLFKRFIEHRKDVRQFLTAEYRCSADTDGSVVVVDRLPPAPGIGEPDTGASRRAMNAKDVAEAISKALPNNKTILLHPETQGMAEQARAFSKASVIVAQHGAALSNIYFCGAHSQVLEIHPYKKRYFAAIAHVLGIPYMDWTTKMGGLRLSGARGKRAFVTADPSEAARRVCEIIQARNSA